ncbi:MAG TPA: hypothetical protein VFA03_06340 [Acetobacteraceae bacterium]|nr:hypothetical protein [Acetobacteraceae bacterium]
MRLSPIGLITLLAAGLFSAEVAVAQPCANAVDQGAFDVAALKSELMLVALTCDRRDEYNQFITRFRPDLAREERALNAWFVRAYGRGAQKQHDDYITNLANVGSESGLQRGTLFCSEHVKLFQSVMSLRDIGELVSFAQQQNYPQPIVLQTCAEARPAARKPLRTAESR